MSRLVDRARSGGLDLLVRGKWARPLRSPFRPLNKIQIFSFASKNIYHFAVRASEMVSGGLIRGWHVRCSNFGERRYIILYPEATNATVETCGSRVSPLKSNAFYHRFFAVLEKMLNTQRPNTPQEPKT